MSGRKRTYDSRSDFNQDASSSSSSSRGNASLPPPPRWLNCPRKSSVLIAGKFLAFKTPLDSSYDSQIPVECRFSPAMLFSSMKSYKVKLGFWIDLTYTTRFYDKRIVEEKDCRYMKLQCRGHGETPSREQATAFIEMCKTFMSHKEHEVVGVHCTHGFNRTGFLIVSYLVEVYDWSVEAAINEFAKARPPGIYKADYLRELFRRYGDIADTPAPPSLPDWHQEFDDGDYDDDGEHRANGAHTSNGRKRRRTEFRKKDPVFMEDVPGVLPVTTEPKLSQIQRRVQDICKWATTGFPGCQPISLDQQNISLLSQKPYMVSWKADGTRYMMLIDGENEVYFIDRDNCVFHVTSELKFLHRKDLNRHLKDTLLDGEMVIDTVNGEKQPRYLIYDIILFEKIDVGNAEFPVRIQCIKNEIVGPRNKAMAEQKMDRSMQPFGVRLKEFWDLSYAKNLLSVKFMEQLMHEPDGLIFQPTKDAYVPGRCDEVLKWKPHTHNSVDFRLNIVRENRPGYIANTKIGNLYVGGLDAPFAGIKVTKEVAQLDNKIIECTHDGRNWVFMRERTDKSFPNSYSTAQAVCESIRNPVTQGFLLSFIEMHRYQRPYSDFVKPRPR